MATPARFLQLTVEQDEALRELEVSPVVDARVRLRASIIRLSNAGWSAPKLATHFGRNLQSVHNDLNVLDKTAAVLALKQHRLGQNAHRLGQNGTYRPCPLTGWAAT